MHLKSLTLKGFKSFAKPTTFVLEPGVTAIVGPNGSGKSNVVDGLAWVMGEQGAKSLRGGKMEDVIFAGTATRGPLGRAEVQLTIDNADGALPIDYSEVSIRRTLFRSGQSEYAINGETCRLLDVQELLSDSGLGREMHVIVGQGRLDTVLRATPEERRGFIEEAAGILKHRRRKEKTVRKLDAMEQNLARLSDLAGEVRRQLKPLGRQAEIARQAQTIAAVVRDAKSRIYADDVLQLKAALEEFARGERERHTERIALEDQVATVRARIAHLERSQTARAVDEAQRVLFGLEQAQERIRGLFTLANQRLSLLGADADDHQAVVTVSQQAIDAAREEVTRLKDGIGDAQDAAQAASRAVGSVRTDLDALDAEIARQSALVSEHDMKLNTLRGSAEAAQQTLDAVRGAVVRQQQALDAANDRRAQAEADVSALEAAEASEERAAHHQSDYERAQRDVSAAEKALEEVRGAHREAEREADALTAKVAALGSALDVTNAAGSIIARDDDGVMGLVSESVQVRAGFEQAIEAVLGPLAEGVLVARRDDAYRLAATTGDAGAVDVVIAEAEQGDAVPAVSGADRAIDVVSAPSGIKGVLASVLIVSELADAPAIFDGLPEGWRSSAIVVTRNGEVATLRTVRAGSGGGTSRLALQAERDDAAALLEQVSGEVERLAQERQMCQRRVQETRAVQRNALEALRGHDARLAQEAERVNRVTVRHEAAVAECERLSNDLVRAQEAVTDSEARATRAAAELAAMQQLPRPSLDVSAREGLQEALEKAREDEMAARLDVETTRERVRAAEAHAAGLENQREREQRAAEQAARRAVLRQRQRDIAEGVAEQLPAILDSVDRSVSQARIALSEAEKTRSSVSQELRGLRDQETTIRERLAGITQAVHGVELQVHEKKLHLVSITERVQSELGISEDILLAEYGPDQPVPLDDVLAEQTRDDDELDGEPESVPYVRAEQEKRLRTAERKLSQLGRVNPLALEEFAALEQRHSFLTEQLDDLVRTRKDLQSIIGDLDERMQRIFADAFEDTKQAFGEIFPILFPGGAGSISLTNPDDMLTTGIEVSVRPVGKKIERLSLLSGGERSLAAVALLTAIFQARPSPFYILDEVEAALDDANLGRLLGVFEKLRENSQLLVITHQKRTMEIADALYGVSMRQDGVSAVVGQRIVERSAS
ncbi:chromosome segregation protein SMC [Microbacterium amylolyticum]|uniref:Chromosome partition protein Smc n=1 Tax=Microbacterium amylolyticum TaxID=936337 RepID=A0ABS4ZEW8_9MICO|nr:chromosome segregation protein SMC [Microbacterium amylolyticum]MBP2435835.1 chromosome segregation protein [Microbacterium amylolyticum]